ncbi:MAG: primosomal protein N' [Proteobacteria bacterium]|nr:primosomal protein N' [Pseudomonadota bacterium]
MAVNRPLPQLFTYESSKAIQIGSRVKILFGKKELLGIVLRKSSQPEFQTNLILDVLDDQALFSRHQLELIQWAADYYKHPKGEAVHNFIPPYLKKLGNTFPKTITESVHCSATKSNLSLTKEQKTAIANIQKIIGFNTHVLQGVTGSGKTEVYLEAIENILKKKQSVLVLVPEISLVPQTLGRFKDRFGGICHGYHSGMTPKARMQVWEEAAIEAPKIIIGTRSSIFKQHEGFRFSARDLLIKRAQMLGIPIVLGSATPSLQTLRSINEGRYTVSHLRARVQAGTIPKFSIIDTNLQALESGLSQQALVEIEKVLEQKQQVLIFLNRRGYAPKFLCASCGWVAQCSSCESNLVFHHLEKRMICHRCDSKFAVPKHCPSCQEPSLIMSGQGTEKIEQFLQSRFVNSSIIRVDRDTTRKVGALENLIEEINTHSSSILIGTRMLTKGHHFPNLALVVIVNLDQSLISLDPFALEDLGQQIIQVAGRAGREKTAAKVLLQSGFPDHPILAVLKNGKYEDFATMVLKEREESKLPPFSFQAILRCHSRSIKKNIDALNKLANINLSGIELFGPVPASVAKKGGNYFHQIILQSSSRKNLSKNLELILKRIQADKRSVKWALDIDPVEY